MAYNPTRTLETIHGVDLVALATDIRLCKTPEQKESVKNGTELILTVPSFMDLGPKAKEWNDAVKTAMESLGFETFWKCGVEDVSQKGDTKNKGYTHLMRLSVPESKWIETLPEFAEKFAEAVKPLFPDEDLFETWHEAVEDILDGRAMNKLNKNAFEKKDASGVKTVTSSMNGRLKLLLFPLVVPYVFPLGEEEWQKKTRGELLDALSEPGEKRESFFNDLSEMGLLHSSFFMSSNESRISPPWITCDEKTNSVRVGIPFTAWRAGGAVISRMAIALDASIGETSLLFGKEGRLQFDPLGSRSMFNASLVCRPDPAKTNKSLEQIADMVSNALCWEQGMPDPRPAKMDLSEAQFAPKSVPLPPVSTSYIKPGDEENKWRKISPSVYVHLTQEDANKMGGPQEVVRRLGEWAQANGYTLKFGGSSEKMTHYLSAYVGTGDDSLNTSAAREKVAQGIQALFTEMGVNMKIAQPISRMKYFVKRPRPTAGGRAPDEMAMKIPLCGETEGGVQSAGLRAAAGFLEERGWSREKLKREELFVKRCPSGGDANSVMKSAEKDIEELFGFLDSRRDGFAFTVENRSPRDERNFNRKQVMDKIVSCWTERETTIEERGYVPSEAEDAVMEMSL